MDLRLLFSIVLTIFVINKHEITAAPPLRIVNGTTADDGEFPYIVQVRDKNTYFVCGGGILGPEWILTAGHCSAYGQIDSVIYGTNKLYDYGDITPNTSIKVKNWFRHPKFDHNDLGIPSYDIGILRLQEPIPFSATAQPMKLVEANATIPFHVQGVLAGWGYEENYGSNAPYLQKINLQLLRDEECTQKINDYSGVASFNETHNICSDDYFSGACYGDYGSPIAINGTTYGVYSWSYKEPCGVVPVVYTRISNPEYRDWIKHLTGI